MPSICTYPHTINIISLLSELYEAKRWHDDPLYQAPMIVTNDGSQLFVGEIVEVLDDEIIKVCNHGKIIKFMSKVTKFLPKFYDWHYQYVYHMRPQKITGELVAKVKPIVVRQGIHVLLPAHATISCKHIRKTSLPFTKHNTVVMDKEKFRPISDLVNS